MRIVRFLDSYGSIRTGHDRGDGTAEVLVGDPLRELQPTGEVLPIGALRAPVAPTNIFCVGLNYRRHAEEQGVPVPELPVIFMKPTTTVTHPGAPIHLPACCVHGPEVDYEAELAVVIGRGARNVPEARALEHVFGYTCANDVSARRWQKQGGGGQWVRGKSFDTFCPLGPVLVTADELPDPQALPIRAILNGKTMQESNTADMIFSVARLVSFLSADTTLLPGTLILTGTPEGVGFARTPPVWLQPGDEITIEIEGIGRLVNRIEGPSA
jgi:2-keto-4-pentenoate hydratase/2-oxohepta-3-ene-1,7-dioic acid hydratase in catechol pathway